MNLNIRGTAAGRIRQESSLDTEQQVRATVDVALSDGFNGIKANLNLMEFPARRSGGWEWMGAHSVSLDGVQPLTVGDGASASLSVQTDGNPKEHEQVTEIVVEGPSGAVIEAIDVIEEISGQDAQFEKVLAD